MWKERKALARLCRTVFRQELKQGCDSTAGLGREIPERQTGSKPKTDHQLGGDAGAGGWEGRTEEGRPNTENTAGGWGKSENEVELSRGKFSKCEIQFVVEYQNSSTDREEKASQVLFPNAKTGWAASKGIFDLFEVTVNTNIFKEEKKGWSKWKYSFLYLYLPSKMKKNYWNRVYHSWGKKRKKLYLRSIWSVIIRGPKKRNWTIIQCPSLYNSSNKEQKGALKFSTNELFPHNCCPREDTS